MITEAIIAAKLKSINDIEAYEKTDIFQRYPWNNTYDLIAQSAIKYGQDTAIEFIPTAVIEESSVKISYEELTNQVSQTANLLHTVGVNKHDVVTILLPSLPQTHLALWGSQAAGISSPINPLLEPDHIIEIMNKTQSKVLISLGSDKSEDIWAKVKQIISKVPSLESILLITDEDIGKHKVLENIKIANFLSEIAKQPEDRLISKRKISGDDLAAYFHTGGTTGRPKIAQLTHSGLAFVAQLSVDSKSDQGRFASLIALPLFHIYGTIVAGIGLIFGGRTIVMMTASGFRSPNVVANWWHYVARYQVKSFPAVPTILNALIQIPAEDDISCLEEITCGSAPLSKALQVAFEEKFDLTITVGYGMTETSGLQSRPLPNSTSPTGSVGIRMPYMQMCTAHVEGNKLIKICDPNEAGVVLVKGPHIFAGYLDPEDNTKAWVDHNWFNTGDMGYIDVNGNLFLTGRSKDLIIRSGHNIDPAIIEEPLAKHPNIAMAVAIGQPDAYAGEVPVVYVTLNDTIDKSDHIGTIEDELMSYCQQHISERAAVPKRIEIIDEIPLTAVAKIFKPALRNRATEFAIQQILHDQNINATVLASFDPKRGQVAQIALASNNLQASVEAALRTLSIQVDYLL
jgi:fatty-acyl-CoA synthase